MRTTVKEKKVIFGKPQAPKELFLPFLKQQISVRELQSVPD